MSSYRPEKVAEAIKQATSDIILHQLQDPRLGFVTVTKVETSHDLKQAKVHISVMGEPPAAKRTLASLRHARRFIQSMLSRRIHLRYTPRLSFYLDDSLKKSVELGRLFKQIEQEELVEVITGNTKFQTKG